MDVATYALLDSRATHLFISESFVKHVEILPENMGVGLRVTVHSGEEMLTINWMKNMEFLLQKNIVQATLLCCRCPSSTSF